MTEFEITCVRHDERGVITYVRINGKLYTVTQIINAITNRDTFHTNHNNKWARVHHRQHYLTKRWYLTTNPDDTSENNLDFLPNCA
jgi:Protein of unknown function (DUF3892)